MRRFRPQQAIIIAKKTTCDLRPQSRKTGVHYRLFATETLFQPLIRACFPPPVVEPGQKRLGQSGRAARALRLPKPPEALSPEPVITPIPPRLISSSRSCLFLCA